jgi:hypothetical protein
MLLEFVEVLRSRLERKLFPFFPRWEQDVSITKPDGLDRRQPIFPNVPLTHV